MAIVTKFENIQKIFNDEKILKHSLDDYTRKDFIKIEEIISKIVQEGLHKEFEDFCLKYLEENQNTIFALYSVGLLYLMIDAMDTYFMPEVIKRFSDEKKIAVVTFLAEKVLSYREEKYALKILEEHYKSTKKESELVEVREIISRIDKKDAYTPKYLAEHYESVGNIEKSIYYYKIALDRFISLKSSQSSEAIWDKLISLHLHDPKYLMSISLRLSELLPHEKIGKSLHKIALHYKKKGLIKQALDITKFIFIRWLHNDAGIKSDLKELYTMLYPNHSMLEKYWDEIMEYLRNRISSYLRTSPDELSAKIHEFEKKLKFDIGKYVYHRIIGIGIIKEIKDNWIYVDFTNKPNHRMSKDIAFSSLDILQEDDIRVWKAFRSDELVSLISSGSPKIAKMAIISLGGKGSAKEIKDTLNGITSEKNIADWWNKARSFLSEENIFASPENKSIYILVSEGELENSLLKKLESQKTFDNKVKVIEIFLSQGGNLNLPSASVFLNFLKKIFKESEISEEIIRTGLVLFSHIPSEVDEEYKNKFLSTVESIPQDEIINILKKIETIDLRKYLINTVKQVRKDWDDVFVKVVLSTDYIRINSYIFSELFSYDKFDSLKKIINKIIEDISSPQTNKFAAYSKYIWFSRLILQGEYEDIAKSMNISKVDVVLALLNIVSALQSGFEERGERSMSKKLFMAIKDIFSEGNFVEEVLLNSDMNTAFQILSLVSDYDLISTRTISSIRTKLYYKYPKIKDLEDSRSSRYPYLVTKQTYDRIKKEYDLLLNDKLPKIVKQLNETPNSQDLIDKHEELKALAEELSKQISEFLVIKKEDVYTNTVDVGTKVTLTSKTGDEKIVYHLLGDKDTDPIKNIISYRSPLGAYLLDKSVGDIVTININGKEQEFQITSIDISEYL